MGCFFFFKRKTAYEMRISDWSSDVCSSDLPSPAPAAFAPADARPPAPRASGGLQAADRRGLPLRSRCYQLQHFFAALFIVAEDAEHAAGLHDDIGRAHAAPGHAAMGRLHHYGDALGPQSAEGRRVGKEWVGRVRYRWLPNQKKK